MIPPAPATRSPAASWATWPRKGSVTRDNLRRAVAYGTVAASFTCQDFSLDALKKTSRAEIEARYLELLEMMQMPK